jgi:hypothetical protein
MPQNRWTPKRKEKLIIAVRDGERTRDEVLAANNISPEEFDRWLLLYDRYGSHGLRTSKVQQYRE